MSPLTTAILLLSLYSLSVQADKVSVNGTFMCRGKGAGNVLVHLYDKGIFSDSKLAELKTRRDGQFELHGEADDLKPLLWVQHMCQASNKGCRRQFELPIPQEFVNSKEIYQMTYIALDIKWQKEEEECK